MMTPSSMESDSRGMRISSAVAVAAVMSLVRLGAVVGRRVGERRGPGGVGDAVDLGVNRGVDLGDRRRLDAVALLQPGAADQQRIALAPLVELARRAVLGRVAAR